MAKKKKGQQPWYPNPEDVRGAIWKVPLPPEARLVYGIGAALLGYMTYRYMPKLSEKVIPILVSAFTPPPGYQVLPFQPYHPEAVEPLETRIDERQLGRSEVIREIAIAKRN